MKGKLLPILSNEVIKKMSWNDQGYNHDGRRNRQLPWPQVVLKEEWHSRQHCPNDTTDDLGAKADDDARHETAKTAKQSHIGHEVLSEDTRKAHRKASGTTG